MIIWLQGPSGAGKTTIGRELATRRGLPFADLDEEIERRTGRSITEIFWGDGEAMFRRIEWNTFLDVVNETKESRVIVLGGGTICDPAVRSMIGSTGVRVFLDVSADVAISRLELDQQERPLLMEEDPAAAWSRLYRQRRRYYEDTDLIIDANGDPATVGAELGRALEQLEEPVWACESTLGGEVSRVESYASLFIAMQRLSALVAGRSCCVIADSHIASSHEELILSIHPDLLLLTLDAGEGEKRLGTIERLAAALAERGFTRDALLVGIGGGVVTDVTGFLASIYMRGVAAIYIPTTLLAQVDAAIGGKTAVNAAGARNLLGTVRQPTHVIVTPAFLRTLPARELRSGFVESLKMGIANSAALADAVDAATPAILSGELPANIDDVIRLSVETKLHVVEQDTLDNSVRMSLNFGHTFGHALEAVEPGLYAHGEAVALGLIAAAEMAHGLGRISDGRREWIIERALPFTVDPGVAHDLARILGAMESDKKRAADGLRFVLPREETGVEVVTIVDRRTITTALERAFQHVAQYHAERS